MDLDAHSFRDKLPDLLAHISDSDFVAFDLELSGIPSRLPGRQRLGRDRATLQDRYAEAKAGADRYQILQIGITCARFDYLSNHYVLRPYNITLSPLIDERLDYERDISFQSGACSFLLNHGFDLGSPFTVGVQYLSRQEADHIRRTTWDRLDKKNVIEDLQLKKEDVQSLDFVRRAREAIVEWKTGHTLGVNITTHTGLFDKPPTPVITNFEKRLVHQLVRAEFPDLVSIGRSDGIRVTYFDALREADHNKRIKKRVDDQIAKQSGFRLVFEALTQDDKDYSKYAHQVKQFLYASKSDDTMARANRAIEKLRHKQPVLVGHNMFTDIVYFYRTFVGELPDTLDEFRHVIHELFPRIVDTKYLATYAEGDLNASPTLQEIADNLVHLELPEIVTHANHSKYHDCQAFHEAGFDSLMTAKIMIQLSAKLDFQLNYKVTLNSLPHVEDSNSIPVGAFTEVSNSKNKKKSKKKNSTSSIAPADRRFHTNNIFDRLSELQSALDTEQESHQETVVVTTGSTAIRNDTLLAPKTSSLTVIETKRRQPMELMPVFDKDSKFWKEFGNRLRVFGTNEKVLQISMDF